MSSRCDVCGKEPRFGRSVARTGKGALKRRIKGRSARIFRPNIQAVRTEIGGTSLKLKVCTSCIKKGSVQRRSAA